MQKQAKKSKGLMLRIGVLCFFVYLAVVLLSLQMDIHAKKRQLENLTLLTEKQRLINTETERLLTLGSDKEYIEQIARDKLGFAYPDEQILIDSSRD